MRFIELPTVINLKTGTVVGLENIGKIHTVGCHMVPELKIIEF